MLNPKQVVIANKIFKKQAVWKRNTEKANAVDTAHRSFLEVKDNGEICVGPQSSDLRNTGGRQRRLEGGGAQLLHPLRH